MPNLWALLKALRIFCVSWPHGVEFVHAKQLSNIRQLKGKVLRKWGIEPAVANHPPSSEWFSSWRNLGGAAATTWSDPLWRREGAGWVPPAQPVRQSVFRSWVLGQYGAVGSGWMEGCRLPVVANGGGWVWSGGRGSLAVVPCHDSTLGGRLEGGRPILPLPPSHSHPAQLHSRD